MSNKGMPPEADSDEVSARLRNGLRSCRAVVDSYRSMIANELGDDDRQDHPQRPEEPLDTVP